MQFRNFLAKMFGPTQKGLVFGATRSPDQQLLFMMDCAARTGGRGFRPDFGERLMGMPTKPPRKKLDKDSPRLTPGGQRGKLYGGQPRLWRA